MLERLLQEQTNEVVTVRTKGLAGHLKEVQVQNFMCHRNFIIEFRCVLLLSERQPQWSCCDVCYARLHHQHCTKGCCSADAAMSVAAAMSSRHVCSSSHCEGLQFVHD